MGSANSKTFHAEGFVAPGFESVKAMFEANFSRGAEESGQLCVYVGEELVVDLWCSTSTDNNYTGDTLCNVFSSTKSLTAIAMAALVDKDLIKYSDKIASHWPEFGQNEKGELTIADLMRHEAGLAVLDVPFDISCTQRENIKNNALGEIIARQTSYYREGERREYHAVTRGWIANEIFRRVHPSGSTIGEHLQEVVAGPLSADIYVGVPDSKLDTYAPVHEFKIGRVLSGSMNPRNTSVDISFGELLAVMNVWRKHFSDGRNKKLFLPIDGKDYGSTSGLFNLPVMRQGESSSVNGNCSARGLAKVAAAMAAGGTFQGVELLSQQAWDTLHEAPTPGNIVGMPTQFTQGGLGKFGKHQDIDVEGFYGWMGYGQYRTF